MFFIPFLSSFYLLATVKNFGNSQKNFWLMFLFNGFFWSSFLGHRNSHFSAAFLFELKQSISYFVYPFTLIFGILAPIFLLSKITEDLEKETSKENFPKIIKVFSNFVSYPLWTLYLVILYLYILKISYRFIFYGEILEGNVSFPIIVFFL